VTGIDLFVGLVIGPILAVSQSKHAQSSRRSSCQDGHHHAHRGHDDLATGFQIARKLGNLYATSPNHPWLIASFLRRRNHAVIALGILEPANIAVLFEMNKPVPNGELIGRLMKRFIYTAGITGLMQVATLIIMTRVATQ